MKLHMKQILLKNGQKIFLTMNTTHFKVRVNFEINLHINSQY